MRIRRRQIREKAQQVLADMSIMRPAVDVSDIAKRYGIRVEEKTVEEEFSGFILKHKASGVVVIGVNEAHPITRKRFTIAHELGHYFLHGIEDPRVDKGLLVIRNRNVLSSSGTHYEEIEANLFAAELLMPATWMEKDLEVSLCSGQRDDKLLSELAQRYVVSDQAMAIRVSTLGYLPL